MSADPAPAEKSAAGTTTDCAPAESHWKAADEIKTLEVYQDHLDRFPSCAFAVLAKARIAALKKQRRTAVTPARRKIRSTGATHLGLRARTAIRYDGFEDYPDGGIPMRKTLAASALLVTALAWSDVTLAQGALAVGMPEGNPAKGFRWNIRVNKADAASVVMDDCHAARNPRTGAACKLIGEFSDQCVAVTSNGEPTAPVTAAGWAIAPDSAAATKLAMAQCEKMRKGRGPKCRLDGENSMLCDGDAK